ncbi:Electron transport complex protein RnfC [Methanosarcina siciliae C2J]|uniref:Ion-translocating oxidoreductase complex subunit C n=2 Tax=Methanosarcina siciliae TaxID=38027 RepID=A0A0E3P462_9EURY|nr:Electron transport complex protein RnfC [Methanosarcina siciliae T4/M]AKB35185.1 Electron transport complex protein RnfC [Methanosarcina siciliae C2J]
MKGNLHYKEVANLSDVIKIDKLPEKAIIPMRQHDGIACAPLVKKGAEVIAGQKLGECEGSDLAYVHSPFCGTVKSIELMPNPSGKRILSVVLTPSECEQTVDFIPEKNAPPSRLIEIIKEAGIVEYYEIPTYLALKPGKRIDTLLMNATFPLITHAYLSSLDKVLEGFKLMLEASGIPRGVIVVRGDDKESIKAFKSAKVDGKSLTIAPIIGKRHADYYLEDVEDQIIVVVTGNITYTPTMMNLLSANIMGRKLPLGYKLSDVHVVVCGVKSAKAVYDAINEGKPYLESAVTVTGAVNNPKTVIVKFGTPIKDVIEACGGYKGEPGKVIVNGSMGGVAVYTDEAPVVKTTVGIVVQTEAEVLRDEANVCIHCGRCVDVCPMNLLPGRIAVMADQGMFDRCREYFALGCIECGECAVVCPAKKHLVQLIRYSKLQIMNQKNETVEATE